MNDDSGWYGPGGYLPAARRCQRVRFSIFLCFFLRMRLRRFLIKDPMRESSVMGPDDADQGDTEPRRPVAWERQSDGG